MIYNEICKSRLLLRCHKSERSGKVQAPVSDMNRMPMRPRLFATPTRAGTQVRSDLSRARECPSKPDAGDAYQDIVTTGYFLAFRGSL